MNPAIALIPSAPPQAQAQSQRLAPNEQQFLYWLLAKADVAELDAARQACKTAETVADVARAMENVTFIVKTRGAVDGARTWVLPHLFADIVLVTPEQTTLRFRAEDVRRAYKQMKATGVLSEEA